MLTERQRSRLPAGVLSVIETPTMSNDQQRALHTVFKVVSASPTKQQPKLWAHFQQKLSSQLRPHVARLKSAYENGA